jgi:RimJ/RimL family protein N-acetyltransferase
MSRSILSVREIEVGDIESIINYWLSSDKAFLNNMGVDLNKLPAREQWTAMLLDQINTPIEQKKSYCIIWELDGLPVGHSNTNPIAFADKAYMHLHLWKNNVRQRGLGTEFVKLTLPYFFKNLKLQKLISEPYALNPAPHKTLQKAGFELVKEYTTTPGSINFEQPVKRWELSYEKFKSMAL